MMVSFLHISDVHLGYQQYGNTERYNDFARAFLTSVDFAIEKNVDFVLICGDLFHKSAIAPKTLFQANEGFERLANAGIQVVAINGNHDKAKYAEGYSWLHYLSYRGHIILLSPVFSEEGTRLDPWNDEEGSYIDIEGVRIFGIPYLGASTEPVLEEMPKILESLSAEDIKFTVLIGHFGLEGEIPGVAGGISTSLLNPLKKHIDYIGLGHLHKPFSKENWIFNPGALEVVGMDERNWHGGYY
jgi:DNA repair exonuclease SbcCD nuclease subunit